jgi:diguanylate cyclase (GGDEF)-like protein
MDLWRRLRLVLSRALVSDAGAPTKDALTGLANRSAFYLGLEAAHARCVREGTSAWLLLVDLDGLKLVNDRYGHGAGDAALQEVAGRLTRLVRGRGAVARIGGDEFAVLLHAPMDKDTAAGFMAAATQTIAATPVSVDGARVLLEASAGHSPLDQNWTPAEAMRKADERMYLAKQRAGSDPFDRVAELVVGLLGAGGAGVEQALASGVAAVAQADLVYVFYRGGEQWWPQPPPDPEQAARLRNQARQARLKGELLEGKWRVAAPLRSDSGLMGAFAVERDAAFTKADRIALSRAGVALGHALQRLREVDAAEQRLRELEDLAFRDENTGLANRRALLAELERVFASGQLPLTLLFVDFDGLRAVNNDLTYEHGNELLRTVAIAIEATLREGELAARLHGSGGDEFIVVCPGIAGDAAQVRATELERALQQITLAPPIAALYGGASVGHAVRLDGESPLEMVERAAGLMRQRKHQRKSTAA